MKPKLLLGLAFLLGGLALCGAGLWLLLSPPQYAATARIKLENDEPDSSGYMSYGGYFPQVSFEIIHSQLVLSNVVAGLNLNEVWGRNNFNGEPLKYHRTGTGQYVLYSVGWNESDDGGVVGVLRIEERSSLSQGDWVWRLP